jgi:hypothetical protein
MSQKGRRDLKLKKFLAKATAGLVVLGLAGAIYATPASAAAERKADVSIVKVDRKASVVTEKER